MTEFKYVFRFHAIKTTNLMTSTAKTETEGMEGPTVQLQVVLEPQEEIAPARVRLPDNHRVRKS